MKRLRYLDPLVLLRHVPVFLERSKAEETRQHIKTFRIILDVAWFCEEMFKSESYILYCS